MNSLWEYSFQSICIYRFMVVKQFPYYANDTEEKLQQHRMLIARSKK